MRIPVLYCLQDQALYLSQNSADADRALSII
jgi:hypothetical protein